PSESSGTVQNDLGNPRTCRASRTCEVERQGLPTAASHATIGVGGSQRWILRVPAAFEESAAGIMGWPCCSNPQQRLVMEMCGAQQAETSGNGGGIGFTMPSLERQVT